MIHEQPIIAVHDLTNRIGENIIHDQLNFDVRRREIVAIVGGSGSGKTTLLRTLLMLQKPSSGIIEIFGNNILQCSNEEILEIQRRWGVMFQQGALFSSLTVLENVMFPLQEFSNLPKDIRAEVALLKIKLAGLAENASYKYPAELSGGMLKRAALARAIALDPELLFLDEPTSGLDPKSARAFDDLILELRESLNLTVVMITHDLATLWRVPDRVAFIAERRVLAELPIQELIKQTQPAIQDYFAENTNKI